MISILQLEDRLCDFFKEIFKENALDFNFSTNESLRYILDRQTAAPRPDEATLLFYRVEEVTPVGSPIFSDSSSISRTSTKETIKTWRNVHVIMNILSKGKGDAKTALNFFFAAIQSERKNLACYSSDYSIVLPLHNINKDVRILTELENAAWTERVETDLYFNYEDTVELDNQQFLEQPATEEDVTDIVQYETELKTKK